MKYFVLDAFTNQPFGGNPAGVVLLDGDTFPKESLMLQIAAELRYSETAFIRRHSNKEFTIRYFTPAAEVELCGHATIASFFLLYHEGLASSQCLCHTLAGDLSVEAGEKVMMQMATPSIVATLEENGEIYKALGVIDYRPNLPVQIAYSGLPDLMIQIQDVATLNALQPDMDAIAAITKKHNAVSYYLRQNGYIGAEAECAFLQGEAMGRPSTVATRIRKDGTIYVGGTAAIVAKGDLFVNQ